MALTTCPECKREVSSAADACPHCGYTSRSGWLGKSGTLSGAANTGCAGCLVLLAVMLWMGVCAG